MVHRRQMLAPVLQPADRAANMPRRERNQEILGIELAAGAKAAANIVFRSRRRGLVTDPASSPGYRG
jgi:hypothetical protein